MTPYRSLSEMGTTVGRAIGEHWDITCRALARGEHAVAEPAFFRLMTGESHPFANMAFISPSADLAVARAAVEPLIASGTPAAAAFPGMDVPSGIGAYLVEHGFTSGGVPAMGVDIASLEPTTLPAGYEFTRIGGGPEGEEWVRQMAAGFAIPLIAARCFSPASPEADNSPDSPARFYAIRRNGVIVATSACYLSDGMAGIYCVSTLPEERGKGLGAHATAEPLRLAAKQGYGVGILQSSEAGYPVYRRLGFGDFGKVPFYVRMPG
ncbi:MAG TPA: GNAT family N-acetyltransferase [Steroidobacteraceae bacterium]|nr:GNAT family N-acetyltransferase [Steroidobacteraceae bacterium]